MNASDILIELNRLANIANMTAEETSDEVEQFLLADLANNINNLVEEFNHLLEK
jgi:hypothetical protein